MVTTLSKKTIGRREMVNLPDFNLNSVEVKIDTGAYSCSIHCCSIKEENNLLHVVFLDDKHPQFNSCVYTFSNFKKKKSEKFFWPCTGALFYKNSHSTRR